MKAFHLLGGGAIRTDNIRSSVVTKVFKLLNEVRKDEEGATMVEYALMVGLIAVVSVLAVTALGVKVNVLFTNVTASLP